MGGIGSEDGGNKSRGLGLSGSGSGNFSKPETRVLGWRGEIRVGGSRLGKTGTTT